MEDRSKLPKWAQRQIEVMESRVAYAERRLRESLGEGVDESDTQVHFGYSKPSVGLPNGTRVSFKLPYGSVEVQVENETVSVSATGGALAVYPHVSNVVNVKVRKRA